MSNKEKITSYFNQIFADYDHLYDDTDSLDVYPSGLVRLQRTMELVARHKSGGQALDLGCGTGPVAVALAKRGFDVYGVDIAENMVERARERAAQALGDAASKTRFEAGDVESLDLEPASLDVVVALGLLEYLPDDRPLLKRIAPALKPDGVFVVAFRNRLFNLFSLNDLTKQEVADGTYLDLLEQYLEERDKGLERSSLDSYVAEMTKLDGAAAGAEPEPGDPNRFRFQHPVKLRQHTPKEVHALAEGVGLQVKDLTYFHFHPLPPAFEKANGEAFNRIALGMEVFGETPVGCAMASAFLAVMAPA